MALYTEFPEDFAPESEPLFVRIDSLDVPLWCERFERRGAAGALGGVRRLGYGAGEPPNWWGRELFVEADEERSDDEFYMEDLIGFAADVGRPAGRGDGLLRQRGQSAAGRDDRRREYLVPAVGEFIAGIDFEGRRLRMTLPEGLLSLND